MCRVSTFLRYLSTSATRGTVCCENGDSIRTQEMQDLDLKMFSVSNEVLGITMVHGSVGNDSFQDSGEVGGTVRDEARQISMSPYQTDMYGIHAWPTENSGIAHAGIPVSKSPGVHGPTIEQPGSVGRVAPLNEPTVQDSDFPTMAEICFEIMPHVSNASICHQYSVQHGRSNTFNCPTRPWEVSLEGPNLTALEYSSI